MRNRILVIIEHLLTELRSGMENTLWEYKRTLI